MTDNPIVFGRAGYHQCAWQAPHRKLV